MPGRASRFPPTWRKRKSTPLSTYGEGRRRLQCGVDGFRIFLLEPRDQFGGGHHLADTADALARAPDFLPGFWLGALARSVGAKTHFRGVGLRKIVRVHSSGHDRRFRGVAMA